MNTKADLLFGRAVVKEISGVEMPEECAPEKVIHEIMNGVVRTISLAGEGSNVLKTRTGTFIRYGDIAITIARADKTPSVVLSMDRGPYHTLWVELELDPEEEMARVRLTTYASSEIECRYQGYQVPAVLYKASE